MQISRVKVSGQAHSENPLLFHSPSLRSPPRPGRTWGMRATHPSQDPLPGTTQEAPPQARRGEPTGANPLRWRSAASQL